jgi:pyruvate/2-oxoglutarate dehydrogenase complex dihydrolipoamide dehydrogenase (E3) component
MRNDIADCYDLLVIGFGKAGKTIAMKRAKAGDRVALVERDAAMFGGTCINIGCVPTKALLVDAARHAYGCDDGPSAFARAQKRRDALVAKLNAANLSMARAAGVEVVLGTARFTGPRSVRVDGEGVSREIAADRVVIDTGAIPRAARIPGADSPRVHTSTSIQHIDRLPERLAIVGGGPIGLEFATMFAGFGSRVTILDKHERALGTFDDDVAACAAEALGRHGVEFMLESEPASFEDGDDSIVVRLAGGGDIEADAVLVAAGRVPATADLNLEAAGIETTSRGAINVDDRLRTSAPNVWAAGDVNGGPQFTYVSFDDHRIIMADAWGAEGTPMRTTEGRIIPTTTFLEPPLSTVGMSEREAMARGVRYEVRKGMIADMAIVPRPKILGEPEGMAKFLVDPATDRILGATLFCADSQELVNTVAVAMRAGMTASELGGGIYTHPTSSELFNALLGS